jgi:hypothetical protein
LWNGEWVLVGLAIYFAIERGSFWFAKEKICRGLEDERMSFGRFFDLFDLTP